MEKNASLGCLGLLELNSFLFIALEVYATILGPDCARILGERLRPEVSRLIIYGAL